LCRHLYPQNKGQGEIALIWAGSFLALGLITVLGLKTADLIEAARSSKKEATDLQKAVTTITEEKSRPGFEKKPKKQGLKPVKAGPSTVNSLDVTVPGDSNLKKGD